MGQQVSSNALRFEYSTIKKEKGGNILMPSALDSVCITTKKKFPTAINRHYFEALMADQQLSLRGLAKQLGMGHSQLSLAFSGARRLSLDEAARLSVMFGEPLHRIVENAGVSVQPVSGRRVPVIGAVRGDGTVDAYLVDAIERVSAPDALPAKTIALQFRTAGSSFGWMDGATVFCREPAGLAPDMLGRLCYVKIKDGPAAVATVTRGYRDATYNLAGPLCRESAALQFASPILITRN